VNDDPAAAAASLAAAEPTSEKLSITSSRHFADSMAERRLSLAFTTYQAGKLFMVGRREGGVIWFFVQFVPLYQNNLRAINGIERCPVRMPVCFSRNLSRSARAVRPVDQAGGVVHHRAIPSASHRNWYEIGRRLCMRAMSSSPSS
jgi:hypothetical protein